MTSQRTLVNRWLTWACWVLGSGVGGTIGFLLAASILRAMSAFGYHVFAEPVIFALIGGGAGPAQSLVLWRRVEAARWWVLASAAGGAVVGGLAATVEFAGATGPIIGCGIAGLSMGLFQWPILRRSVRGAGWWLLASPTGWSLGALVVTFVGGKVDLPVSEAVGIALLFGMMTGISGTVTGFVLAWLTQSPGPKPAGLRGRLAV